jgi:hypothetical protein
MKTAARIGTFPVEEETTPTVSPRTPLDLESEELAAARAELDQVRSQLYSVLEGARAAFSAEDAVVRVLTGADQIDEVSDSVLEALCESFEFDTATFWMLDPDDGKLIPIAHRRSPTSRGRFLESAIRPLRLSLSEGAAGRAFVARKEFLSEDAVSCACPELVLLLEDDGLRTVCAFPIISSGAPVGAIEMERREAIAPHHAIESAVRIIGERIGAFIEYGQLRWRFYSLADELERKLAKKSEASRAAKLDIEPDASPIELDPAA